MKTLIFILGFLCINYTNSWTITVIQSTSSKYINDEFIKLFNVNDFILSYSSPCSKKEELAKAFDNNFNNYWLSAQEGTKCIDQITGKVYTSLKVNITIEFTKVVSIQKMIYQAYSTSSEIGLGFPIDLQIYYSTESGQNAKFNSFENIKYYQTDKRIVYNFSSILKCKQINLEWKAIHSSTSFPKKATAKEIIFLAPESYYLNETILNAYDKSDYRQLTLNKPFNDLDFYKNVRNAFRDYEFNNYMREYLDRIGELARGRLNYDPFREFSTKSKANIRLIHQRGDIEKYARNTLKMAHAGTNRQSMGIYGRSNEKINFYVKVSKSTDPLPRIRFAQYIGSWGKWLSKEYQLVAGKNTLVIDNFTLIEGDNTPTFPGGPIYIVNPYTPSEQGEISVYVDGGTVFPSFRIGDDEAEYRYKLSNCIDMNKKDNLTYFDITELMSDNAILTLRASDAYKIYSSNNKGPTKNMQEWDKFLKDLYRFDGVQLSSNQPYYDEKNKYINIHYQYVQTLRGAAAFATTEYVGIFLDEWFRLALDFDIKTIGWGFAHETGHMLDIPERVFGETSNNMISKFYDASLAGSNSFGIGKDDYYSKKRKYLVRDDQENKLRGCTETNTANCKGYLSHSVFNYLIWWDLESVNKGYWGALDNMYRYNNTLPSGISKEEKIVYFSSLILKLDLGYYLADGD